MVEFEDNEAARARAGRRPGDASDLAPGRSGAGDDPVAPAIRGGG